MVQIVCQLLIVILLRHHAIICMIAATSVFTILFLLVWHAFTRRLTTDYRLRFLLADTLPFALTAAAVMLITWWLTSLLSVHYTLLLVLRIALAGILYMATMYAAKAEIMRECLRIALKTRQ